MFSDSPPRANNTRNVFWERLNYGRPLSFVILANYPTTILRGMGQLEQSGSTGSRTRTGCITCRIRKKKCDEQRPACQACRARHLACYGFDVAPPSWYTSKASWQQVRESDEAKSLRTSAETRYKISRKFGSKDDGTTTATLSTQDLADSYQLDRLLPLRARPYWHGAYTSPSSVFLHAGANIWQLHPESLWWDNKIKSLVPNVGSSPAEETRLLMIYIDVIHPITHTFCILDTSRDRSWMLERLVSKRSVYYSALSISACFDHSLSQPPSINNIGLCPKVGKLQNRAICDLRVEVEDFAAMDPTNIEDFVLAGIGILDVVVLLKTLEIFSMLGGQWEMHHRAARKILDHIEACGSTVIRQASPNLSVIRSVLSSLPDSDTRRRSVEFCISNFIWVDVLAISTFGASCYPPCTFDYFDLLQSGEVKPEEVMGCKGWIMAAITKIARLEQWKQTNQDQVKAAQFDKEWKRMDKTVANELENGIDKLEKWQEKSCHVRTNNTNRAQDVSLVSIIWAYGAQVLRSVIISDVSYGPFGHEQPFVELCLQKLEALPTRLVMRTSWAYTIAGSMASTEAQQARFRWILRRTMQEAQPPGIAWKGLIVMEECWRLRRSDPGKRIGWREAMDSLGVRVLLT